MNESSKINELLHESGAGRDLRARVGETLTVDLPSVPLTRYTKFVRLDVTFEGDRDSFDGVVSETGEGHLAPRSLKLTPRRKGQLRVRIQAVDSRNGQPVAGVDPFLISIRAGL